LFPVPCATAPWPEQLGLRHVGHKYPRRVSPMRGFDRPFSWSTLAPVSRISTTDSSVRISSSLYMDRRTALIRGADILRKKCRRGKTNARFPALMPNMAVPTTDEMWRLGEGDLGKEAWGGVGECIAGRQRRLWMARGDTEAKYCKVDLRTIVEKDIGSELKDIRSCATNFLVHIEDPTKFAKSPLHPELVSGCATTVQLHSFKASHLTLGFFHSFVNPPPSVVGGEAILFDVKDQKPLEEIFGKDKVEVLETDEVAAIDGDGQQ